jgi:hypothetical protein
MHVLAIAFWDGSTIFASEGGITHRVSDAKKFRSRDAAERYELGLRRADDGFQLIGQPMTVRQAEEKESMHQRVCCECAPRSREPQWAL